jgi:hypothetical protein
MVERVVCWNLACGGEWYANGVSEWFNLRVLM